MIVVAQLVNNIAMQRNKLTILEQKLKEIQLQCSHDFLDKETYRVCKKCNVMESIHY